MQLISQAQFGQLPIKKAISILMECKVGPMEYTVVPSPSLCQNPTHIVLDVSSRLVITPEVEKQLMLWKLKYN